MPSIVVASSGSTTSTWLSKLKIAIVFFQLGVIVSALFRPVNVFDTGMISLEDVLTSLAVVPVPSTSTASDYDGTKGSSLRNVHYSPYRYERRRVPIKGPLVGIDWLDMFKHLSLEMRHEFTFNGTIEVGEGTAGTPSRIEEKTEEEKARVFATRAGISKDQVYDPLNRLPDVFGFRRGDGKQVWKKELLSFLVDEVAAGKDISCRDYTDSAPDVATALKLLNVGPNDRLLVGGSISPWIEAIALHHGVGRVVTVDYNEPFCDACHDRLTTISMDKLMRLSTPAEYSHIISYSSIEHDGLGRYGDPFDPWGDMHAMKEFWTLLKDEGVLLLAVPTWSPDKLTQLLARNYGPIRLPWLIQGWEYMGTVNRGLFSTSVPFKTDWTWHPIIILRKRGTSSEPPSVSSYCSINCTAHDDPDHMWRSTFKACAASSGCSDLSRHFPALTNAKQIQSSDVIQTWELRANATF